MNVAKAKVLTVLSDIQVELRGRLERISCKMTPCRHHGNVYNHAHMLNVRLFTLGHV